MRPVDSSSSRGEDVPDMQESQAIEASQRYLLGQLIDGRVADGEDRDAVDAVVAHRIRKQDARALC